MARAIRHGARDPENSGRPQSRNRRVSSAAGRRSLKQLAQPAAAGRGAAPSWGTEAAQVLSCRGLILDRLHQGLSDWPPASAPWPPPPVTAAGPPRQGWAAGGHVGLTPYTHTEVAHCMRLECFLLLSAEPSVLGRRRLRVGRACRRPTTESCETMLEVPTAQASTLKGHTGPVLAARFSSDGNYCMTCGQDRLMRLWNPVRKFCMSPAKCISKTILGSGRPVPRSVRIFEFVQS